MIQVIITPVNIPCTNVILLVIKIHRTYGKSLF